MTRLIVPLDVRVAKTVAEHLYSTYGLTAMDLFRITVAVWPVLEDSDAREHYEVITDELIKFPHLSSLSYHEFMTLAHYAIGVIYRLQDVLRTPVAMFTPPDHTGSPNLSFVQWLPAAAVIDLH